MSLEDVPKDQPTWSRAVLKHHGGDPATVTISDFGRNAFGSASKLAYQDWLFLKIVWSKSGEQPSHEDFFGTETTKSDSKDDIVVAYQLLKIKPKGWTKEKAFLTSEYQPSGVHFTKADDSREVDSEEQ